MILKEGAKLIGIPYECSGEGVVNAVQLNPVVKRNEKYIDVLEKKFKCSSYYFAASHDQTSFDALSALGTDTNTHINTNADTNSNSNRYGFK